MAAVAKLLDALVVDARAMARSVAAMFHGYATFDPELRIAGIVLNRAGSRTHEKLLPDALKPSGIPILGVLRRDDCIRTPDRHLGLVPVAERREEARRSLEAIGTVVSDSLNLNEIVRLARSAGSLAVEPWSPELAALDLPGSVRVGVATGPSFSFLYRENLELLEAAGAEVVTFDPTAARRLVEVGVGVGPGDPELLTVKCLRVLREADEVYVPVAVTGEVGRAEATVREYLDESRMTRLLFALSDDAEARERNWTNAAREVSTHLRSGKRCAFATIGDPNVYSTFTYLARTMRDIEPHVEVETVPGITAMEDLASRRAGQETPPPATRRTTSPRPWCARR